MCFNVQIISCKNNKNKTESNCKEAAILRDHRSTVAKNVDLVKVLRFYAFFTIRYHLILYTGCEWTIDREASEKSRFRAKNIIAFTINSHQKRIHLESNESLLKKKNLRASGCCFPKWPLEGSTDPILYCSVTI